MFKNRIKNIYLSRHILWTSATKQLKSKYAGSFLGIWLAIVNPLLLMLAVTGVFSIIFKIQIENFPFFLLSGIFPWMFFSTAVFEATFSVLNQKGILHQFNFPREIIPLASVLSNFLNFLIGWCIIYPLFLIFNPKIIRLLPLLVVVLVLNLFFVWGLGLVLSALTVFFRDLGNLLGVLLMVWFWITPIFYSLDMIPLSFRWICNLNPLTPYIVYYREVIFRGNIPGPSIFIGIFLWGILSVIGGLTSFSQLEPKFLKHI
jgi:ABC-2 type transport system permease protein